MEMTEDSKGIQPRTWNAITAAAMLLAIAGGMLLYNYTGDISDAFWTILVVFGAYMAAASVFRDRGSSGFGPSSADASAVGGMLLVGVGLAGISYSFTASVMISVVVIIVVVAVVGIIMAVKNREEA